MFTLCFLCPLAMLTIEVNLSSLVHYLQDLEMLMFIYIMFEYGLDLSSNFIVFGIRLFIFDKLGRNMSLISLKVQQCRKETCTMASSSHVIKSEVFDGACFKRSQIKTCMWLTDLKCFWVVLAPVPEVATYDANAAARATTEVKEAKWDEANQACLSQLLNVLSNRLFEVYSASTSTKVLWAELENKFSKVDNGNESFATESYLDYKMSEGMSVMEQLQEIQLLVQDLVQYNCNLPDSFHVNVILTKLLKVD
jgi:hypothetical protein